MHHILCFRVVLGHSWQVILLEATSSRQPCLSSRFHSAQISRYPQFKDISRLIKHTCSPPCACASFFRSRSKCARAMYTHYKDTKATHKLRHQENKFHVKITLADRLCTIRIFHIRRFEIEHTIISGTTRINL